MAVVTPFLEIPHHFFLSLKTGALAHRCIFYWMLQAILALVSDCLRAAMKCIQNLRCLPCTAVEGILTQYCFVPPALPEYCTSCELQEDFAGL